MLPLILAALVVNLILLWAAQACRSPYRRHRMPLVSRPANCWGVFATLSVKAIREKIGELTDRAQAIVDLAKSENRELQEAEQTELDQILGADDKPGQIDVLKRELARAEKLEKIQAELAGRRAAGQLDGGSQQHGTPPPDDQPLSARIRIPVASQYRFGKLKAFAGPRAEERAYIAGQFWAAALFRNKRSIEWCRQNGIGLEFQAALESSTDTSGGYLVPVEVEQAIIDLRQEYGVFRQKARIVPMLRDTKTQPVRNSGLTAYFVDENAQISDSDKSWTNATLTARKLAALCKYSNEIAEDAIISIGDDLTQEIAYAFAVKEDACGFLGDGTSTYGHMTGLKNALAAGSKVTAVAGNTSFGTLDLADFESMVGKLPMYPGIRPEWYISQVGWAASMMRLMDAAGGNTWANLAEGPRRMFLGYPVNIVQTMNAVLTAQASTDGLAYFGDLAMAAMLGTRRGMSIAISGDRYFEYDQMAIRGIARFDINIHSRGDASDPGAIVMLSTPSS